MASSSLLPTAALLASVAIVTAAQATQFERDFDTQSRVFKLIDAAYPELREKVYGLQLTSIPQPREHRLDLTLRMTDQSERAANTDSAGSQENAFFSSNIAFDQRGLSMFEAAGRFVGDPENAAVCRSFQQRGTFSDQDLDTELVRRGAHYSVQNRREVAQKVLPAGILADVTGSEGLTITDIRFVSPGQNAGAAPESKMIGWQVTYRPLSGHTDIEFTVHIEPFHGMLKRIIRQPPGSRPQNWPRTGVCS